jgi:hypothetical protein
MNLLGVESAGRLNCSAQGSPVWHGILSMTEILRRKVLTSKEIVDLLEQLRTLPKEDQQFDHEVRHNRILSDMEELPKWRARFSELSPEDRERIERVEKVHAQEISIHRYIGQELGLKDPPADQYVSHLRVSESPVSKCIREARAMQLQIAEKELAALSVNWSSWQSPMSGVVLIDRPANPRTILKQIALMPIVSIRLLILSLLAPFDYMAHLRNLARKSATLKDEIRRLRTNPMPLDEPSVRTLRDLWFHCGISDAVPQLDLLCQWVDILYGSGRSAELKIRERVREIGRQMGEANLPYYEGKEGACHFYFRQPIDTVMDELSEELRPFRGA